MTPEQRRSAIKGLWYMAAVVLSIAAIVFAIVSQVAPRIGYPLTFVFTSSGILAYTWPSWDNPKSRLRLVILNVCAFATEIAILYFGMASQAA